MKGFLVCSCFLECQCFLSGFNGKPGFQGLSAPLLTQLQTQHLTWNLLWSLADLPLSPVGISGGSPGILCSQSWGQLYENKAARHSYGHMMWMASPHTYPLLSHWTSFTATGSKMHLLRILRCLQQSVNQAQDPLHIHTISRDMCWLSFYICGIKGVRQNDLQCAFLTLNSVIKKKCKQTLNSSYVKYTDIFKGNAHNFL